MNITNTGAFTGSGVADGLINIVANSLTTGLAEQISTTGITTGSALRITGNASMSTTGELVDLNLNGAVAGAGLTVTSNGAYTGVGAADGLINVTANSLTTGFGQQISATGLSTGAGLEVKLGARLEQAYRSGKAAAPLTQAAACCKSKVTASRPVLKSGCSAQGPLRPRADDCSTSRWEPLLPAKAFQF
jgi:hypothetical protein